MTTKNKKMMSELFHAHANVITDESFNRTFDICTVNLHATET
jgi:hypothetical protein